MEELEKAHQDYEERKQVILYNLETISSNLRADPIYPNLYSDWIDSAISFIKEKEI